MPRSHLYPFAALPLLLGLQPNGNLPAQVGPSLFAPHAPSGLLDIRVPPLSAFDGLLDGSIPTPASSVLAGVWPIQGVVVTPGNQIALTNTARFRLL